MTAYIVRRLIYGIIVFLVVTILVFLAMRLLPGDPILIYVVEQDLQNATPEVMDQLRAEFGLDKPIPVQYINWLGNLFRGDLGDSIHFNEPVSKLIAERLPVSLYIAVLSFLLASIFGVTFGVIAGLRRNTKTDTTVTSLANFGISLPHFWLAILLIFVFGVWLGWLPTQGFVSPFEDLGESIKKVIMPVFVISAWAMAFFARQARSSILEIVHQDYIRTAWAKGLNEKAVIIRHALKNAFIPIITVMGMSFVMMVSGQVVIENVFSIPGIGRLIVAAIFAQDYAIVQGCVMIIAVLVILANLIVDVSYGWFDPRIRYN
ncbi:MAG: ABC transporter permease [Dehalococcoidales bacterium]|nr:ABC transporter permease [Dehalococcoidales bacterium]